MRDYGLPPTIWDGSVECQHEWRTEIKEINQSVSENSTLHGGVKTTEKIRNMDGISESGFCVKCGGWRGSLGLEPHPLDYINHMVVVCRELKRVLKKTGSLYLDLGDTYFGSGGAGGDYNEGGLKEGQPKYRQGKAEKSSWLQPKQLLGIPERIMIALQESGWILRNKIVWYKPNHMPSSVKDRLTNSWEYVFHFVKNNKTVFWDNKFTLENTDKHPQQYYKHDLTGEERWTKPSKKKVEDRLWFDEDYSPLFMRAWDGHDCWYDLDSIRQPHMESSFVRVDAAKNRISKPKVQRKIDVNIGAVPQRSSIDGIVVNLNPLGKNPADVLQYNSKYEQSEYGQTLQGFIRNQSISERRVRSREEALKLFPNDPKKQQEYINYIHDHDGHPLGKNPSDVYQGKFDGFAEESEKFGSPRARTQRKLGANTGANNKEPYKQNNPHQTRLKQDNVPSRNANMYKGFNKRWKKRKTLEASEAFQGHPPTNYYRMGESNTGKNPGDFWRINTRPFKGAHFATFPPSLVTPIIKSSCPEWICVKCGKPRTRITKTNYEVLRKTGIVDQPKIVKQIEQGSNPNLSGFKVAVANAIHETVGWSDCGCGAEFRSGVVLDPFIGSGTTMLVAQQLKRSCIGIELSRKYCEKIVVPRCFQGQKLGIDNYSYEVFKERM